MLTYKEIINAKDQNPNMTFLRNDFLKTILTTFSRWHYLQGWLIFMIKLSTPLVTFGSFLAVKWDNELPSDSLGVENLVSYHSFLVSKWCCSRWDLHPCFRRFGCSDNRLHLPSQNTRNLFSYSDKRKRGLKHHFSFYHQKILPKVCRSLFAAGPCLHHSHRCSNQYIQKLLKNG